MTTVDEQRTASEAAIKDAFEKNDVDAYMRALKTNPDYATLFKDGIDPKIAAGIRADFARDHLPPGAQGLDFSKGLQDIWQGFQAGGLQGGISAIMKFIGSLFTKEGMSAMFNKLVAGDQPDQKAGLDKAVNDGKAAAPQYDDAGATSDQVKAYDKIIGLNTGPAGP